MDGLQTLLDNSSTPVLTAFLLGLLTALSPCPLATNIAAISFIGKEMEDRKRVFRNGLLYTLGRILAYTLLGFVLILILKEGSSMFGIQKTIGTWGERVLGPALFGSAYRKLSVRGANGYWGLLYLLSASLCFSVTG